MLFGIKLGKVIRDQHSILRLGGSLPLIFCIHIRSKPIYRGAVYLAEKIKRYGIFQNKGKFLYFKTLVVIINFLGKYLKLPYFTYTAKENWKEDCNSSNALNFSLPACS